MTMSKCSETHTVVARGSAYSRDLLTNLHEVEGIDADASINVAEKAVDAYLPECGVWLPRLSEVHACLTHSGEVEGSLSRVDPSSLRSVADQLEMDYLVPEATRYVRVDEEGGTGLSGYSGSSDWFGGAAHIARAWLTYDDIEPSDAEVSALADRLHAAVCKMVGQDDVDYVSDPTSAIAAGHLAYNAIEVEVDWESLRDRLL